MNDMSNAPGQLAMPLTREQEALWVEWKLSPTGVSYNTCVQTKLRGDVDVDRFAQAASDVAGTFQLLRAFCHEDGGQVSMQLSDQRYLIDVIDVSSGAEAETDETRRRAQATLTRRRDAAIDLTAFPLIRAALVKSGSRDYYFIGVVPHIISDGFSALFVLQAISLVYDQGMEGLNNLLGDDRKDWNDYLAWRAAQDPAKRLAAVEHWQQTLAGATHQLPICQRESPVGDTLGRRHYLELDKGAVEDWSRLTRSKRTSLFSALAALYAAFLYRQTDHEDLIIAHPVNQRPPGFRLAFGFYVNVVPLRIDLAGNPSFSELVERIGRTRRNDRKHHHLPSLDIIQAKRQVQPDFDGRLTNVSMGETVSRFQGMSMEGIASEGIDNDAIDVRDDLSLMYEVAEDRIGLWLEYRISAFDDEEIERMGSRLKRLAAAIQANPELPLAEIDVLSEEERTAVLCAGDGGEAVLPKSPQLAHVFSAPTLAEAFFRQCELKRTNGTTPALIYGPPGDQRTIGFAQLADAVRLQASRLQNEDVMPHKRCIGVCLPRSPQQVIAVLGVMASGNTYVPVDPKLPDRRAAQILVDCDAWGVIAPEDFLETTDEWQGARPAPLTDGELVELQAQRGEGYAPTGIPNRLDQDVTDEAGPGLDQEQKIAYVIYTSGSTGQPKGVRVDHESVLKRLAWLQCEYELQSNDRMLANTSYTFDVSVAELFWPLLAGTGLVLAEDSDARDARRLREIIAERNVTALCIVPSALTGLLQVPSDQPLGGLRLALVAGEALPESLAQDFHSGCRARLVNLYGPTEAVVYATATDIDPLLSKVSIGTPLAATKTYVLNDALQLQPPGAEGELCIGGGALAIDYLGRDALSRERFLPNPHASGRLYRSGDRVRLDDDGNLIYLGRADSQVKLRGYRIELGEIDHAVREHPAVTDAASIVAADSTRKQLVCFYSGAPVVGDELQRFLQSRLPAYMIPNRFQRLDQGVPRLPSGKLNRGALPAERGNDETPIIAPRNARERTIVDCWARILGVPKQSVGIQSNFFELGGDSLLLISLACELENHGLYIEVHELFDNPTIEAVMPLLRDEEQSGSDQSPVVGRYPALARHRKLFDDGFAHPAHWNRCILIEFQRLLDRDALQEATNAVSTHHDGLRISFYEENSEEKSGEVFFSFHPQGAMPTDICYLDLSALPENERDQQQRELLNEINASFDLGQAPLIRVAMIDDERTSTIALVVHHLLIDMRSCQILLEDLLSAYQAAISHRSVRLPRKTSSLAEWTQRLHATIDGNWQREELPYWLHELAGVSACLPEQTSAGTSYQPVDADQRSTAVEVSQNVTERLVRGIAPLRSVGMQDLVLTAFASAFRNWSQLDELVLNTCGVGRDKMFDDINLTRTVGELNTVYPIRLDLGRGSEGGDLLDRVAAKLKQVPARGLHYGMLRHIAAHPELKEAGEPEVFFNYVSRIDTSLGDALGARVRMAPADIVTSHPKNRACYRLYAEASIHHGCLELDLAYDSRRFDEQHASHLLALWRQALEDLAANKPV